MALAGWTSHRGGHTGFARSSQAPDGGDLLTLPDYVGNFMFNTLGNLLDWPQAGLLFIDWQQRPCAAAGGVGAHRV